MRDNSRTCAARVEGHLRRTEFIRMKMECEREREGEGKSMESEPQSKGRRQNCVGESEMNGGGRSGFVPYISDKADHNTYIVRGENWHVSHPDAVR